MTPREVVESFWQAMRTNDFFAAGRWLAEDFTCHWPQSSELICGRVNFAEINTRYPAKGAWQFDVVCMVCEGNNVVTDVLVTDGDIRGRAITFHVVEDGLISRQTEFWPDDFAPPAWRRPWVKLPASWEAAAQIPDFSELCARARSVINPRRLTEYAEAGGVGAALLTGDGNVYTGVCIDTASSMGFCAEHAAAAAMITAGESRVVRMVAVDWNGEVMPPCGRCREMISQLHTDNIQAEVLIRAGCAVSLAELLPHDWKTARG
ncbi:MAG: hypothetical protein CVV42_10180 [Candidatus Riflebacteria bacterium HGW-Riflebacteria-2]|jgi:cytidine deaminase/limonene-1,2-epoxide hydrolase|nr:MAG: hypothetical protein CVV42_10180 [Candidatus Riflebacteria bacterium HGW-Riflebacteria-2]